MKRLILILFAIGLSTSGYAQLEADVTPEDIYHLFRTKTMVLYNDQSMSEYFIEIKDKVNKHWDITEYEFITDEQYEEMRQDPNLSFLMVTQGVFRRDKSRTPYNFLTVMIGTPGAKNIQEMKILARIPLSYYNSYEENWVYNIGTSLKFLQKHLTRCKDDPDLLDNEIYREYSKSKNWLSMKGKTILVAKDDLSKKVDTKSEIKEYFPGEVKIVSQEEIEDAIDNDEDVLYAHVIKPENTKVDARCFKLIMGAKDAEIYYFEHHKIKKAKGKPGALLKKDFKKMKRLVDPNFFQKIFY
jgi:hypothetical protein